MTRPAKAEEARRGHAATCCDVARHAATDGELGVAGAAGRRPLQRARRPGGKRRGGLGKRRAPEGGGGAKKTSRISGTRGDPYLAAALAAAADVPHHPLNHDGADRAEEAASRAAGRLDRRATSGRWRARAGWGIPRETRSARRIAREVGRWRPNKRVVGGRAADRTDGRAARTADRAHRSSRAARAKAVWARSWGRPPAGRPYGMNRSRVRPIRIGLPARRTSSRATRLVRVRGGCAKGTLFPLRVVPHLRHVGCATPPGRPRTHTGRPITDNGLGGRGIRAGAPGLDTLPRRATYRPRHGVNETNCSGGPAVRDVAAGRHDALAKYCAPAAVQRVVSRVCTTRVRPGRHRRGSGRAEHLGEPPPRIVDS